MKALVVLYQDAAGAELPIEEAGHQLKCEATAACVFPRCPCGPRQPVLDGKLRPSYEQQVAASDKRRRA